jgi:ABC-type multidrug transport system ATPase subunit
MGITIDISGISKSYGDLPVLRGCSFTFQANRTYAILGVNGAGKSTLLRILALLENPDTGEVRYLEDGRPHWKNQELKRKITLVLPQVGVFNTTVFQNVAYGLKIRGLHKRDYKVRVERLLDLVGLTEKQEQKALTLSSGQIRRLGLARAMVIEPDVLLLDEPTASLDPGNTKIIETAIRDLRDQRKTSIIMSTHDFTQARELADSILAVEQGQILEWSGGPFSGALLSSPGMGEGEAGLGSPMKKGER